MLPAEQRQVAEDWASLADGDCPPVSENTWDSFDDDTLFQLGAAAQLAIDTGKTRALGTANRFLCGIGHALLSRHEALAPPPPRQIDAGIGITLRGLSSVESPEVARKLRTVIEGCLRSILTDLPRDPTETIVTYHQFGFSMAQDSAAPSPAATPASATPAETETE